jgi:hypothetical protein
MKENVIGFIGVIMMNDSEKYSSVDLLLYTISVILIPLLWPVVEGV